MTVTSWPGVYVEEVSGGARPIDAAGTSTPAFFGFADRGPIGRVAKIFSFAEFLQTYGGFRNDGYLAHGVYQFFQNGGQSCYVGRVASGCITATVTLADRGATPRNVLEVSAQSAGLRGNTLRLVVTGDAAVPGRFALAVKEVVADASGSDRLDTLETFTGLGMNPAAGGYVGVALAKSKYITVKVLDNTASAVAARCTSGKLAGTDDSTEWVAPDALRLRINLHGDGERLVDLGGALSDADRHKIGKVAEALRGAIAALSPLHTTGPDLRAAYQQVKVEVDSNAAGDEHVLRIESGLPGVGSTIEILPDAGGHSLTAALKLEAAAGMVCTPGSAPMCPADTTAGQGTPLAGGSDGTPARTAKDYGDAFHWLDRIRDVSLIAVPGVALAGLASEGMSYCAGRDLLDCFFIADLDIDDDTLDEAKAWRDAVSTPNSYGAAYFPWLRTSDPTGRSDAGILMPPSGFVAGLYAKTDFRRGVWKAPAGTEASIAALDTAVDLTNQEHGDLNLDNVSICAIRKIPGAGIVVWGARTMSSDPEYRYIPVRRTAIMLRKSIHDGIQWAVFEGNDERLWSSLRVNIGAFMNQLFRAGAFQGSKASDAYFVRCGLGSTMTQDDIDAGRVIVEVGFAPLKPAEFVIVRIQQQVGQA